MNLPADISLEAKSTDARDDSTPMEKESVSSGSTSSIGNDDYHFGKFCRHVPRILRHQLISKLVNQYVYKIKETDDMINIANRVMSKAGDAGVDFKANTSIYRFHGALLFVDISGFTVLSQKLKVDDLKNHINDYFQKIVDIINKYDGEIIKFAGDALFIVWQTKVSDTADPLFLEASKDATDKAVTCGKEINLECGNYPIKLTSGASESSSKVKKLLKSIGADTDEPASPRSPSPRGTSARPGSGKKVKKKEALVTYLNVHAGVSIGVMAGMDVGAQDRFEYLLLGQPMNDVAIAEGDADKGEIVISPATHALLHNFTSLQSATHSVRATPRGGVQGGEGGEGGDRSMDGFDIMGSAGGTGCAMPDSPHKRDRADSRSLPDSHPLACGCTVTPSGYFKINTNMEDALCVVDFAGAAAASNSSSNAAMLNLNTGGYEGGEVNVDLQYEFEVYAQVVDELLSGYKIVSPLLQVQFSDQLKHLALIPVEETKGELTDHESSVSGGSSEAGTRATIDYTEKEMMTEHFFSWAQHCLLDDIAKHAHEVVRKGYSFYKESREAPFDHFLRSPLCMDNFRRELERMQGGGIHHRSVARHSIGSVGSNHSSSPHSSVHGSAHGSAASNASPRTSVTTTVTSLGISPTNAKYAVRYDGSPSNSVSTHRNSGSRAHGESFVTKMRQLTDMSTQREKKHNKHQKVLSKDGALVSELRNVIVLFISVKINSAVLFVDPCQDGARAGKQMIQTCKVDSFHFLARTMAEIEADKKLINQFQSCMEVVTEVFHSKGGQLRQFIVDDKGTVCIGTFGLRGSVNYDNAASAIDAADSIVARLQALGFNASVGVTSGAAYCGLVGSNTRHEYAVMGPSTNLSARLMGRAAEGEIICDSAIRQRDRAHTYASLGAVKAKGYVNPVPIFRPQFGGETGGLLAEPNQLSLENPINPKVPSYSALPDVYGRRDEIFRMFRFFFADAVKGGIDQLTDAFWNPAAAEEVLEEHAHPTEPFDFAARAGTSSKKRARGFVLPHRKVRFNYQAETKKSVVISTNGMGKTVVLNLFQHKLHSLVEKDSEYYNVAVFRHQVGYINTTTLFSAWLCQVRQVLHSIASTIAASGDPQAVLCLTAMQAEDDTPIMEFLKDYFPPMLQPYIALMGLVGLKFKTPVSLSTTTSPTAASLAAASEDLAGDGPAPESGKTDPISVLDPSEKLQRCAELAVALVQLHVNITRKLTVFMMDDLQHHDVASQDLGRLVAQNTTGVLLLCTFRTSTHGDYQPLRADSAGNPMGMTTEAPMFGGAGFGSYEAAMHSNPESNTFLKTELKPIGRAATKKLLLKIFLNYGIQAVEEPILDKLHVLSNGSPLYATELAKGICNRYITRECTEMTRLEEHACNNRIMTIIDSMRTERIEEMVHFRFDKLTEQCQLVLKMAAVAAVNGSHFTLSMLTWILDSSDNSESSKLDAMISNTKALLGYLSDPDEDGENGTYNSRGNVINSNMDLVQAINDLLESEDFIEFRGELTDASGARQQSDTAEGAGSSYTAMQLLTTVTPVTPKPDLNQLLNESNARERSTSRDRSSLQQLRFHWKVDMELRAIYDLMLDEQKESLHDRVASFLEQEAQKNDMLTATDWYEQAFHWERSTSWSSAMTCYFNSGMLLKELGDTQGCKAHFASAYRMLDRMRHDANVKFLDGMRVTEPKKEEAFVPNFQACGPGGTKQMMPTVPTDLQVAELANSTIEYLSCGRNVGMKLGDLHRMFEGSSYLLYIGLSVLVRLAQTLIGGSTSELSYRMFEDAMDILMLTTKDTKDEENPLLDADGGPFCLRNENICFPVMSGMFLLLLSDQVTEPDKYRRMLAVVSLHILYARSKPEYEVHLILAYQNKLRLLESLLHLDGGAIPHMVKYTDDMIALYNKEKHSKGLIHYYNSDRTANAVSVLLKVQYMQGHFASNNKYLAYMKESASKQKHFFSMAIAVMGAYPIMLLCFPDAEAQIIVDRYMQVEGKQMNKDFAEFVLVLREALYLTVQHRQFEQIGDESVFDTESELIENMLQSRALVQSKKPIYNLNSARLYFIAMEYVAARICYLKALRYEFCARSLKDADTIAAFQAKSRAYLQLGLEHLEFTPEQDVKNEQHVFAKVNERFMRVQILLKLIASCEDGVEARAMWATALANLEHCVRLGLRCDFQLVLLEAGVHLQALASVALPPLPPGTAEEEISLTGLQITDNTGNTESKEEKTQEGTPLERVEVCAVLKQRGAAMEADARAYLAAVNEGGDVDLEGVYKSILMQY